MERLICVLDRICVWSDTDRIHIWKKEWRLDLRKKGSGNAGTTNALSTTGLESRSGYTAWETRFKCVIAAVVSRTSDLWKDTYRYDAVTFHVCRNGSRSLGHNYPFYLKFKGGKGIAATAGLIISTTNIWIVLICLAAFIAIVATTRYVSLGSMTVVTIYLISVIVYGQHRRVSCGECILSV